MPMVAILALGSIGCTRRGAALPKNDYRVEISGDIPNFHFLIESDKVQTDVVGFIYETLTDRDPDTYELMPLLAKSWKISKDGMSFDFELDERAKWPDGSPVTSADVAFTMEKIFAADSNTGPMKAVYGSLEPKPIVKDDRHFTIKAKTKHFKNFDLAGGIPIISKKWLEGKDFNKGPMLTEVFGTGPYTLHKWEKNSQITLIKREDYWGKDLRQNVGAFNFKHLVFKVVQEPKVGIEMLKDGFHSMYAFNPEHWERYHKEAKVQDKYDTYEYVNKSTKGYSFIGWNNKDELFKDKNTRLALAMLTNRPLMIEKFTFGHALPAVGPVSSRSMYFPSELKPVPFDPATATQLLQKSGWKNNGGVLSKGGKKFEFEVLYASPLWEKYLTLYKEDLQKVGIVMNLKRVDWTTFTKLLDDRKFQAVVLAWTEQVHPDFEQIWHSAQSKGNGSNFVGYANAEVDQLIKLNQETFDSNKRKEIVSKIVRLIVDDAPYAFLLENPKSFVAARKGIKRPKDYLNYSLGSQYWSPQ